MKKTFLILMLVLFFAGGVEAKIYSEDNLFGIENVTKAVYKKIIPLGESSYIVQKRGKFGLIDLEGKELIPAKYPQAERILGKYLKIGSAGKFALYNEKGEVILPHEYSSIDLLFGGMFLTCKNYKYGVIRNTGEVVLENKFDDIYMPKPNVMVIGYNGKTYEIEQNKGETLELPEDVKAIKGDSNFTINEIITNPATAAGYSVVAGTDYFLKVFSSISPAHEKTIDELMLSQGAETVSILIKLGWLPKYPIVYAKNYYQTIKAPNNGPLSGVKSELKRKIQ